MGGLIYLSQWHKGPIVQNGGTYYSSCFLLHNWIGGLGAWGLVDQSWVSQFFAMNFHIDLHYRIGLGQFYIGFASNFGCFI